MLSSKQIFLSDTKQAKNCQHSVETVFWEYFAKGFVKMFFLLDWIMTRININIDIVVGIGLRISIRIGIKLVLEFVLRVEVWLSLWLEVLVPFTGYYFKEYLVIVLTFFFQPHTTCWLIWTTFSTLFRVSRWAHMGCFQKIFLLWKSKAYHGLLEHKASPKSIYVMIL